MDPQQRFMLETSYLALENGMHCASFMVSGFSEANFNSRNSAGPGVRIPNGSLRGKYGG